LRQSLPQGVAVVNNLRQWKNDGEKIDSSSREGNPNTNHELARSRETGDLYYFKPNGPALGRKISGRANHLSRTEAIAI